MPAVPPVWTHDDLVRDTEIAVERFRQSRLGEPQQKWLDEYDQRRADFKRLLEEYGVKQPGGMLPADIARLFADHPRKPPQNLPPRATPKLTTLGPGR
jgi:hypothetical protein